MPGHESFGQWLLCLAKKTKSCAKTKAKKFSRINQNLLLGESAAVWDAADKSGFTKVRPQSWTFCDSAVNARAKLKGHSAEEFQAENNGFQRSEGRAEYISDGQAGRRCGWKGNHWRHYLYSVTKWSMVLF